MPDVSHRRRGPHAAPGKASPGAPLPIHPVDLLAQPLGRTGRAHRHRPGVHRRRHRRLRRPGRRAGGQRRPLGRARRGLPERVPATTVDRQCGSSQQAIHFAAQGVISGAYDMVVAAGVETHEPRAHGLLRRRARTRSARAPSRPATPTVSSRRASAPSSSRPSGTVAVPSSTSSTSRPEPPLRGGHRAGLFDNEIVPLKVPDARLQPTGLDRRGHPQHHARGLAGLRPAFEDDAWPHRFPQINWRITAGNSSQLTDGTPPCSSPAPTRAASSASAPCPRAHDRGRRRRPARTCSPP